jgi:hypothetical protein
METNDKFLTSARGGRRPGAGRKRRAKDVCIFRLSLRLDIVAYNKLLDYSERTRQSQCAALREILRKLR